MNDFLTFFHFIRPLWLLAIIPVILLTILLWVKQKNTQQWRRFISPHLLSHLLDATQVKQRRWPLIGLAALWLISIIAIAGPAWEKIPQPVEQDIEALVICWDLSPSMLAEDVKPSRLVRSRLKVIDLLLSRQEGQAALIAYSGEAYTVTPLTDDTQTIINLLPALAPLSLPTRGSNPEMALEQAHQLLKDAGIVKGNILFVTDEIDTAAFDYFENELSNSPHQLTVWGVGTKEGAPIPLPKGGFAKTKGNMIIAKLNENALLSFTAKVGAYYVPMQTMDKDIKSINRLISSSMEHKTKKTERVFDRWFEHGPFLVLFLLPFIAYLFRRGWIFSIVFLIVIPIVPTQPVYAFEWQDLWETKDQQAQKQLLEGDKDAALRFSSHERRGSELYKQERFEEASGEFSQGDTATDAYNYGNALIQGENYEEAIKAYKEALNIDPEFDKAKSNLDTAKQLLKLAKKQEQEGEDGEKQDGEDGEKQDGEDGEDGEKQDGEDGEKQDGEEQNPDDNPFSEENIEQAKKEAEEENEQEMQAQEEDAEQQEQLTKEQSEAIKEAMKLSTEEKEQKQKLETWLRKVPDDPSGLMKNKFQYEYEKRRRSIQAPTPFSIDDPEKRW